MQLFLGIQGLHLIISQEWKTTYQNSVSLALALAWIVQNNLVYIFCHLFPPNIVVYDKMGTPPLLLHISAYKTCNNHVWLFQNLVLKKTAQHIFVVRPLVKFEHTFLNICTVAGNVEVSGSTNSSIKSKFSKSFLPPLLAIIYCTTARANIPFVIFDPSAINSLDSGGK